MKLIFIVLTLIFFSYTETRKFDHVRQYLAQPDKTPQRIFKRSDPVWLVNSNTIGVGYNPLYGSPVCYTGECLGEGLGHPVFELNYVRPASGSCTSALIPEFAALHCLPSADFQVSSETISNLKQLSDSTSQGISFGVDGKYMMFSAAYSYSRETRSMIDETMKKDQTALFTRGQVTFAKLSMFEPLTKLSDKFQYVINSMPCCDDSAEIDEYVNEFIIDYFGLTFVKDVFLGGVAQETLFIGNKEMQQMKSNGEDASHSANIGFYITLKMDAKSSYNQTQQDQFMQSVKHKHSAKLGGDPSLETMTDWIKSVPNNPVVTKQTVKDISTLLTPERFSNDSLIQNKSKLLDLAFGRYLTNQKPTCLNECTDANHGVCQVSTSTPFLVGTCTCQAQWRGSDCSEKVPLRSSTTDIRPNAKWNEFGRTVAGGNGQGFRPNQLSNPLGLYVDDDQSIYIADSGNHRVMKWSPDATSGQLVAGGIGPGVVSNQLNCPYDVIVDKEENSLIVCDKGNNRLVQWPRPIGVRVPHTIVWNIDCRGLTTDDNGYLYASDNIKHEVRRYQGMYDGVGTVVAGRNGRGNGPEQFFNPHFIFVDRNHSVYVSDHFNHRVMQWEDRAANGTVAAGGQGEGNALSQMNRAEGVVVDQLGTVYVTDRQNHRIMRWPKGSKQGSVIIGGRGAGSRSDQLNYPSGLSFDQYGNLYVADWGNHRVQKFAIQQTAS